MGFFDLLSPLFLSFDELISPIFNPLLRVIFWAFISAVISNSIFKWLSNPEKISSLKTKLKSMQQQLNQHDGEFSEFKSLAIGTIKVSIKRMGMTFFPAMIASLPLLFVLTYLSNNYGLVTPKASEDVQYQVNWSDKNNSRPLTLINKLQKSVVLNQGSIHWPQEPQTTTLLEADTLKIVDFPLAPSPIVHKKQWWNALIGNPAGYLPAESNINSIVFEFQNLELIEFGPNWARGWLFIYFTMTIIFSFVFIILFKIKF
jgi:uncharacterized membrane protein (DUF106 family)